MRDFSRYLFRGREGLLEYLKFIAAVFAALFFIYMVFLCVLVHDGETGRIDLSMYELIGGFAAGIGCAVVLDRLLHIAVNFGVSRTRFRKCILPALPVFALITTGIITLLNILTITIFDQFDLELSCYGNLMTWVAQNISPLAPRMLIFNTALIFCQCLFFYTLAMLYTGCKNRFNLPAGLAAAGITGFLSRVYFMNDFSLIQSNIWDITARIQPIGNIVIEHGSFYYDSETVNYSDYWYYLFFLIALAFLWYLAIYAVFAKLIKRAEICGKEQGGQI